jgi:hypothetical protein
VRGVVKAPYYFGQASCMNGGVCPATVIAATNCQLYALSRDNLLKVLESWPEVARVLNMHTSAKDWPAGRRGSRADAFSPGYVASVVAAQALLLRNNNVPASVTAVASGQVANYYSLDSCIGTLSQFAVALHTISRAGSCRHDEQSQ